MPGPRSTMRRSTRPATAPASIRTAAGRARTRRWRCWPGWPRPARAGRGRPATRGSVSSSSMSTRVGRAAQAGERGRHDLLVADGTELEAQRSALEAAHVEQVADERVEAVALLVDGPEELEGGLLAPVDVALQEAGDRRLDRCQRAAEVVGHGPEQRHPQLVGPGQSRAPRRPAPPSPAAPGPTPPAAPPPRPATGATPRRARSPGARGGSPGGRRRGTPRARARSPRGRW